MITTRLELWSLAACLLSAGPARAAVKPHGLFTDGAVLQQGMKIPVWGTAGENEKVTVLFRGQKVSARAKDGKWQVWLKPVKAGGPYNLTIVGDNTVELHDVLVGEVYLCSGQSNMEWPTSLTVNASDAIARSADPKLHLYTVPKAVSNVPLGDVAGAWLPCGPDTVPSFSAVAYFFGRDLRRALKVPVGLIHSSWGGTPAEAWTSRPVLQSAPELRRILSAYETAKREYVLATAQYQMDMERHREAVARAREQGTEPPRPPTAPYNPENQNRPTGLYNAMIAPLIPYGVRGAIWYQGESNAGRAYEYLTLFPAMIKNWRDDWGEGDFPFFFVQLAPFMAIKPEPTDSAWAELREAQRQTALTVPKTGMAVITDVGDERDIHPRNKEPVGTRLALAARGIAYGEHLEYTGPTYDSMEVKGNRVIVRFRHTGGGLVAKGDRVTGFTVAGPDRQWVNAEAKIDGRKVIVWSPQVSHPVAVRYGWADYPVVNLHNTEGLPASPFRTDDFPFKTKPLK
jgi:sialate O-acetylesterase